VGASPGVERIVSLYATYQGPQEVLVAAKVRPASGRSTRELARDMDGIDRALRRELPEVAEVFIDLSLHGAGSGDRSGTRGTGAGYLDGTGDGGTDEPA
jgi:hypothetical protein